MNTSLVLAQSLSILAFASYGVACIISPHFEAEFERYGLPKFRRLIGLLEIMGALGLLIGFIFDPLRILSAGCLSLLMVCGIAVRIKIKDNFLAMLPALILMLLNIFICFAPK
jgi:hypothetical protein